MRRVRLGSLLWVACAAVVMRALPAHAQLAPATESDGGPESHETGASPAQSATTRDVVLLDAPERLDRALRAALSPWGMRVARVVRPKPIPTLPGTALNAGALAQELDAKVLVWISSNSDGAALWIYEASKDTITVRPFPDKPIDQALAAALALSVKTWLRSSDLRPGSDLKAAPPEPEVPELPLPIPVAEVAQPEQPPTPIPPPSASEPVRCQIMIHAAARHGAYRPATFETRYGVEVRLAPWRSDAGTTELWLGSWVDLGEAQDIASSTFRGVYSEWGGGISAGIGHRLVEAVAVALHVGGSVHRGSLSGTLLRDMRAAGKGELGADVQFRPELELSFGPVGFVLQPTIGVALSKEIYNADEEQALETQPVWWMIGGAARVNVF
jgi:hypothetical protein